MIQDETFRSVNISCCSQKVEKIMLDKEVLAHQK